MTVDELSAMIDECAGESVLHEAYAADFFVSQIGRASCRERV